MEVRLIDFDVLYMEIFVLFIEETVWHDWVASYLISFNLFAHFNIFSLILQELSWENRLPNNGSLSNWTFSLKMNNIIVLSSCCKRSFIYLFVFRSISSRVRVDIVRFHVLTINGATNCWVSVTVTIRVEGRLTEISGNGRIR